MKRLGKKKSPGQRLAIKGGKIPKKSRNGVQFTFNRNHKTSIKDVGRKDGLRRRVYRG